MKNENLIHIKFGYDSALESKKDILASEIDLLKISQRLIKYRDYRLQELEIKEKMEKKFRALKLDIGRLHNLLPGIKIPKILKPETKHEKITEVEEPKVKEEGKDEIDTELQQIQQRLNALQR
jgi:hypothetical protein